MDFLTVILLSPIFFLTNAIVSFLWFSLYRRNRNVALFYSSTLSAYISFILILTAVLLISAPATNFSLFDTMLRATPTSLFYQILTIIFTLIFTIVSKDSERALLYKSTVVELHFIRITIVIALMFLALVNNLIILFFFLEVYSLAAYILVAFRGKASIFSSEAGIKYFLLGTLFSLFMVYGTALIYGELGTLNVTVAINMIDSNNIMISFSVMFILSSILFKLSGFPFHFWAPDVYEGSPTSSMFFLSIVPKAILMLLLLKIFPLVGSLNWTEIVVVSALGSISFGSIAGVYQKRIKRLLAYSAINNTGFMLLAASSLSLTSTVNITFFLVVYLITSMGIFIILLSNKTAIRAVTLKNLSNLTNMFFTHKARAISLGIFLFSSAGIPPLVGFLAKYLVLLNTAENSIKFSLVVALILSTLSVFYYIRILKVMSFSKKRYFIFLKPITLESAVLISATLVLMVVLFAYAGLILNLLEILINELP